MSNMTGILRIVFIIILVLCGLFVFWPGDDKDSMVSQNEQLTSKTNGQNIKYRIRMVPGGLYMPGTTPYGTKTPLQGFVKAAREFENKFPDTRIEFTNAPVSSREYLITQLSSQNAPDIIAVNVEDVWPDTIKGWYVALDQYLEKPNPFVTKGQPGSESWWDVFKYQAISRGKTAPDGKTYGICYDMVETGIFYNKNIFSKLHLAVPETWSQFLDVQEHLAKAGYTPIFVSMVIANDWCVDLFFDQLYHQIINKIDLKNDQSKATYMKNYLDAEEIVFLHQKSFFTSQDLRYREIFRLIKQWRKYWNKGLSTQWFGLSATDPEHLREFITGKGAMIWDNCMLIQTLKNEPAVNFDWDVFYLPAMTSQVSPYASGKEFCVIGGAGTTYEVTNSAFADTGDLHSSKKLDRVIQFLQFITTPQINASIVNEAKGLMPNVVGVEVSTDFNKFEQFLSRDYTSSKWAFTFGIKFSDTQKRMLHMYLDDWIDIDELMTWLESNVNSATRDYEAKHPIDIKKLEHRWQELGGLRGDTKVISQ